MDWANKKVLVVGGSGVLGAGLATELAARGANVFATCSSPQSANRIPGEAKLRLQVDLANPESIKVLTDYLGASTTIDGVVLAAGKVGFGDSQSTSVENARMLSQINFLGPVQLISQLLPNLKQGQEPFVAAVTGVVAEKVFPGMHAYSASKFAFSAWLQSLRLELRTGGVAVFEARPGHTETGLAKRPLFGTAPAMPTGMEPARVVTKILEAISEGKQQLNSSEF